MPSAEVSTQTRHFRNEGEGGSEERASEYSPDLHAVIPEQVQIVMLLRSLFHQVGVLCHQSHVQILVHQAYMGLQLDADPMRNFSARCLPKKAA